MLYFNNTLLKCFKIINNKIKLPTTGITLILEVPFLF